MRNKFTSQNGLGAIDIPLDVNIEVRRGIVLVEDLDDLAVFPAFASPTIDWIVHLEPSYITAGGILGRLCWRIHFKFLVDIWVVIAFDKLTRQNGLSAIVIPPDVDIEGRREMVFAKDLNDLACKPVVISPTID